MAVARDSNPGFRIRANRRAESSAARRRQPRAAYPAREATSHAAPKPLHSRFNGTPMPPFLRTEDEVDREGGWLSVNHQLKRIRGKFAFAPPKGSKVRDVSLPPPVAAAIKAHPGSRGRRAVCIRPRTRHARPEALLRLRTPGRQRSIRALSQYLGHTDPGSRSGRTPTSCRAVRAVPGRRSNVSTIQLADSAPRAPSNWSVRRSGLDTPGFATPSKAPTCGFSFARPGVATGRYGFRAMVKSLPNAHFAIGR